MRVVMEAQRSFGQSPIEEIEFDARSRDDIPAVLRGLHSIYMNGATRARVFEILEEGVASGVSHKLGRRGMDLWRIFVLGVVKQALNCDYDRLTHMANYDSLLRQMLGHGGWGEGADPVYHVQTIIDNVGLLSDGVLGKINEVVVAHGHARLTKQARQEGLRCRVDSAVTKTHVHWPTDVSLLRDAGICLLRETARLCRTHGIAGWRKEADWAARLSELFQRVRRWRGWRHHDRVRAYLHHCGKLVKKVQASRAQLGTAFSTTGQHYLDCVSKLMDQVDRRLLRGEEIPHWEKIISVHEPHTRWINKGKAGVLAELGLPVCVLEDQHQYILHHQVLYEGTDSSMIVDFIREAQVRYPSLTSCSMDKGYFSESNRKALAQSLDLVIMPKKGRLSQVDKDRESAPDFAEGRRQHPAVESAINNLNQRGLDLVRTHGKEGFGRTVALSVVAANVHRLGLQLKRKEERRRRWHQARKRAA